MANYFLIKYYDKEKNQINKKPLEEIIEALLPYEIDEKFHIEALKSQAIIMRTNLLRDYFKHGICNVEFKKNKAKICDNKFIENIKKAVDETESMVIVYKDELIRAEYHNTCGGSTENSENVIGNKIVYLRRVLCDKCYDSCFKENEKIFSVEEIEKRLNVNFSKKIKEDPLTIDGYVENVNKDECGRIISLDIGGKKIDSNDLVEKLDLNSNRFSILPTSLKFITMGKGHGLGLCQYGAEKMAQEGYRYHEILEYYYTGIDIIKYKLPSQENPLLGVTIVLDPGHGGNDIGHKGNEGILEKDIVLKIAMELRKKLQELGATIILTRDKDIDVIVTKRAKMTNDIRPNFFISLHMDYFPKSTMKGCELYYFEDDLESKKLGEFILQGLKELQIWNRGLKEGNFFIFRGINVSSLLIELGYLSNADEEIRFKDENYIQRLVEAIAEGILRYFKY